MNTDKEAETTEPTQRDAAGHAREREFEMPWMAAAVASMRVIPTITAAAQAAGVNRVTVQRAMHRDEVFAIAMFDARDAALDTIESALVLRARTGQPSRKVVTKYDAAGNVTERIETEDTIISDTAALTYLKRWRPEYRESFVVEQTGPGGGPIQVETRIADAVGVFDAEVVRLASGRDAGAPALGDGSES